MATPSKTLSHSISSKERETRRTETSRSKELTTQASRDTLISTERSNAKNSQKLKNGTFETKKALGSRSPSPSEKKLVFKSPIRGRTSEKKDICGGRSGALFTESSKKLETLNDTSSTDGEFK